MERKSRASLVPSNLPVGKDHFALFAISHEIAAIRNRENLKALLKHKLKSFFEFNDIVITSYDPEHNVTQVFLEFCEEKRSNQPQFQQLLQKCFTESYPGFDRLMDSVEPEIYLTEDLVRDQTVPDYISFIRKEGISEFIGINMRKGDTSVGCLYLFSEHKNAYNTDSFEMIRSITDLLSIAVANIEANEELLKKNHENAVLLSLSNAIASIRNKSDLFQVIDQNLKKIFPFDGFLLSLINEDQQTHSPFLYKQEEKFQISTDIEQAPVTSYTLNDGLCRQMMDAENPIVFNVEEIMAGSDPPVWLGFWYQMGIREMIAFAIHDRDKCTGFFYLYAKQLNAISNEYCDLLRSIGLQISVAVSNIKANEKIESQLLEIKAFKEQLEDEKVYLREQIETNLNHGEIVGQSEAMEKVFHLVNQVSASDSTVLILGETGSGKELIARAIHNESPRRDKIMIKLNCATLPPNLIESELFGHEKGSFTGATERRIGKFELANNSSLFLDEIGELSLELQVKLLRALQEKEIERIGGKGVIKINVRIIAATNRNLFKEMQAGTFRSDLYYRLNVFPILLPPLRDRKEDISVLAVHFIARYAKKAGKSVKSISQSVLKKMNAYNWPGNIRELEHMMERSVLLATGNVINEIVIPKTEFKDHSAGKEDVQIKSIFENERDHILNTLRICRGKISGSGGAAEILGIPATTLNSKIKKFNIRREHILK